MHVQVEQGIHKNYALNSILSFALKEWKACTSVDCLVELPAVELVTEVLTIQSTFNDKPDRGQKNVPRKSEALSFDPHLA